MVGGHGVVPGDVDPHLTGMAPEPRDRREHGVAAGGVAPAEVEHVEPRIGRVVVEADDEERVLGRVPEHLRAWLGLEVLPGVPGALGAAVDEGAGGGEAGVGRPEGGVVVAEPHQPGPCRGAPAGQGGRRQLQGHAGGHGHPAQAAVERRVEGVEQAPALAIGAPLVERAAHEARGVTAAPVLRRRLHAGHPADRDEDPGHVRPVGVDRDAADQLVAGEGAERSRQARQERLEHLVRAPGVAEAPLAQPQVPLEVVGRQAAVVWGVGAGRRHVGGAGGASAPASSARKGRNMGRSAFVRSTIVVSVRSTPSSMNSRSRKPSSAAGVATRTLATNA